MVSQRPAALVALVAFAWLVMAAFLASLVLSMFGRMSGHISFEAYAGGFLWVPYLWIAGLRYWPTGTPGERSSIIRFTRWLLWGAMFCGLVDLALAGWSAGEAGHLFWASPWRFVGYWGVSAAWLGLLRTPAVNRWAESPNEAARTASSVGSRE